MKVVRYEGCSEMRARTYRGSECHRQEDNYIKH